METRTDPTPTVTATTTVSPTSGEPYIYHQDPSHGWLAVPAQQVRALGLTPTRYSYSRAAMLYLEEDCDMPAFMNAFRVRYHRAPRITDAHSNYDSPIRRFPRCSGART